MPAFTTFASASNRGQGALLRRRGQIPPPSWVTASGSLGTFFDLYRVVNTSATASGDTVTYSVVSGSLPSGVSLNSSTGAFTGTAAAVGSNTTYNFTVRASNGGGDVDRAFSFTVNAPVATTYNYTGSDQTFTVPSSVQRVKFKLWGAGGGGRNAAGGNGGFTESTIGTTGSTVYTLVVGQGSFTRDGGLNYGGGRRSNLDGGNGGGDGGGRSAVLLSTNELLTAGGGGGGGYSGGGGGGNGGGLTGSIGAGTTGGGGGTQTAGGAGKAGRGGTSGTGTQPNGGTTTTGWTGGGGGGGWWGGGGGAGATGAHNGGGGGSGWVGRDGSSTLAGDEYGSVVSPQDTNGRTDTILNVTYFNTVCIRGNNTGDAYWSSGIGQGNGNSVAGGNGRIVVFY